MTQSDSDLIEAHGAQFIYLACVVCTGNRSTSVDVRPQPCSLFEHFLVLFILRMQRGVVIMSLKNKWSKTETKSIHLFFYQQHSRSWHCWSLSLMTYCAGDVTPWTGRQVLWQRHIQKCPQKAHNLLTVISYFLTISLSYMTLQCFNVWTHPFMQWFFFHFSDYLDFHLFSRVCVYIFSKHQILFYFLFLVLILWHTYLFLSSSLERCMAFFHYTRYLLKLLTGKKIPESVGVVARNWIKHHPD